MYPLDEAGSSFQNPPLFSNSLCDKQSHGWISQELLFPLGIYLQDVITDSLLTERYYQDLSQPSDKSMSENCSDYETFMKLVKDMSEFPNGLEAGPIFFYSLSFLLLPIGCYCLEWYFQESHRLSRQVSYSQWKIMLFYIKSNLRMVCL